MTRRILVTSALPYANGQIHLGHLVEYIQTDIWVRFQKLRGHRCIYLCADDTHGTAITIRARQEGRPETEVIADMRLSHLKDFGGFQIEFDNYGSTNSEENRELCHEVWAKLRAAGLVVEKSVSQLYDPVAKTFLADRFVRGTCPVCKSPNQYGDNCDKCGSTYTPSDLIDPVSSLSGATPEVREAPHLFIQIEQLRPFLEEYTQSGQHLQTEVANYLRGHFLTKELRDWDVSRPAPYFGFEIPDYPGHYWYVWFDAPIGYCGSTLEWCRRTGEDFATWWRDGTAEVHHFIGKDITYFHTLFWPAMLKTAELNLPTRVHIHGFLTVDGEKMSKSKGTFVMASTYLKHLDPTYLRYYYATKLGPRLDDIDLNLDEFVAKVNSDLVGKLVNLASRTAKFVESTGLSANYPDDGGLFAEIAGQADTIATAYEECDFGAVTRQVMALADAANRYVEDNAPWTLRKDPSQASRLQDVCTVALNAFRQLVIYLAPVLPRLAEHTGRLLQPIQSWDDVRSPLLGTPVGRFEHLLKRVDSEQVTAMINEGKAESPADVVGAPTGEVPGSGPLSEQQIALERMEGEGTATKPGQPVGPGEGLAGVPLEPQPGQWNDSNDALANEPLVTEHCTIDDFVKVDLRVGRVLEAKAVEGSDKLIQLTVSLGGDVRRNIFAGLRTAYDPATLVGKLVIFCANLAPRKMRFGTSEGMVLAAGGGGKEIYVLEPDSGAVPGMRVH